MARIVVRPGIAKPSFIVPGSEVPYWTMPTSFPLLASNIGDPLDPMVVLSVATDLPHVQQGALADSMEPNAIAGT